MLSYIKSAFSSNFANFKDRATRGEYWTVHLVFIAVLFAMAFAMAFVATVTGLG